MEEKQILKQLNSLSEEVKPREKWVNMTKSELLNSQQEKAAATLISKAFSPLQKPVMALTALGLIALTLGSAMFYSPQMVKIDEPMPQIAKPDTQLADSVEKLDASLKRINERLATVEDSNDIGEVIPKLAAIEATAQQVAEIATDTEALASVGTSAEETATMANTKGLQLVGILIEEFEAKEEYLTPEDQERLSKARDAYEEGDYHKALLYLQPLLPSK